MGASNSWNPQDLSKPVMELLCIWELQVNPLHKFQYQIMWDSAEQFQGPNVPVDRQDLAIKESVFYI
jgi:hypothetical protein